MHSLTVIGMVIIAIGTLIGTYCIQKGNQLKSRESSEKQLNEMNNLKTVLNEQNATLVAQNTTLASQKTLLDEQLKIIKEKELENFFAARHEYELLVRKWGTVDNCMFSGNCSKDIFFKLTHDEIIKMIMSLNEAVLEIKACKFVSLSHYLGEDCWGMLSNEVTGLLYNLSFREGDKIKLKKKKKTTIINVDKKYLDEQYEQLQNILNHYGEKRRDEIQKMTKTAYEKYGSKN